MHKYLLSVLLFSILFQSGKVYSQAYDPLNKPNTYRSSQNPNYWKNKPPFPGYWQQDVHYDIKAEISERSHVIDATEELTYWNNSPDTLTFVYFHLYQNAFQPGSYNDNVHQNNGVKSRFGIYESMKLGTLIEKLEIKGKEPKTELDNTILKVYLDEPLYPGQSMTFNIKFKTFFDVGTMRRRMKIFNAYGYKHFDGVHWYPRICVYDRKFGWTTDQHLGKEFYGDFGAYDVELTFANNYVVEATGNLLNSDEVLPEELRKKLDISNFKDKPWDEKPSVITPYDSTLKKTWKYHAENVHDFAFTADPTYRIGEYTWNGISCVALVQEPHASRWQNAAEYAAKCIQVYSEDIGMYVYHKMVVADARDGMEYPMLTLDGGQDPDYHDLLAHEIGHNWFFGQVGNNETYRAALDEGFTQFLTAWALRKIDGELEIKTPPKSKYIKRFKKVEETINTEVYNGYIFDAVKGADKPLNTHSDHFDGALRHGGGYRHVYYKTATMLYNLQYVLGDELFLKAMQNYFSEWKIAHPYFEDFRNSIIHYTKVDLNWFFDQWLETTKNIDYGIKSVKKGKAKNEYIITFERKGKMQMPIDFQVVSKDSVITNYHIPNTWFVKETNSTVLPKWLGWEKLNPTYEANIIAEGGIKNIVIDTTSRLADVNILDNSKRIPVDFAFDSQVYNTPDWKKYEIKARPDLWYNGYDGIKIGFHVNGNHMNYRHIFGASVWFNTGFAQAKFDSTVALNKFDVLSFVLNYKTSFDMLGENAWFSLQGKALDGMYGFNLGVEKWDRKMKNLFYFQFKSMLRPDQSDKVYLLYADEWGIGKLNNTFAFGIKRNFSYRNGGGNLNLEMKAPAPGSAYSFTKVSLDIVNKFWLSKLGFNTRFFAQYGTGRRVAPESALYLAGANPEEMMENKYTRSRGFFPYDWAGTFGETTDHFHYGGGLNLRGYAGYLVPFKKQNGEIVMTYRGTSGAAVNLELEFDRFLKIRPKLIANTLQIKTYLFADAGIINADQQSNKLHFAVFRMDAGVGTALVIKKWGPIEMAKPLTIRFDMPLFLNSTPAVEPDYFKFRWILAVSRAF